MNAIKKQHVIWAKELLEGLVERGITGCEWRRCGSTFGAAPAHSMKRRFIGFDRDLYFEAAVLCTKHHHYVEYGDRKHRGTHRRMRRLIRTLIALRA